MSKIVNYLNMKKPKRVLTEGVADSEVRVFMNTWNNYNEFGADSGNTPTGWMSVEEAQEYVKKYNEFEPFINDYDNCPFEISEYDNASSVLENLAKYEELDSDEQEMVSRFYEHGSYKNFDDIIEKIQNTDYTFIEGVTDDYSLGKAYFDMVGIDGITNLFQYCDRAQIMRTFRDNDFEDNDLSDSDYYAMADEEIENMEAAGNLQYAEDNFDFEALGRDLAIDGYTFVEGGALFIY